MQTSAFRHWLKTSYLQISGNRLAAGTQISRSANCSTIEQYEGDLDVHFDNDGMTALIERLSYSTSDQSAGFNPRHGIPIRGDRVNGSTTYRSAANLYRKFRVAQGSGLAGTSFREHSHSAPATERKMMTKIRVGQDRFRYLVLERWDYRCAVTQAGILLTASHIKPWRTCSDQERLDAFNGICLSPVFDKAFDAGVITFCFDGHLILSPNVPKPDTQKLGLNAGTRLRGLGRLHRPYLEFHHTNIWQHGGMSVEEVLNSADSTPNQDVAIGQLGIRG